MFAEDDNNNNNIKSCSVELKSNCSNMNLMKMLKSESVKIKSSQSLMFNPTWRIEVSREKNEKEENYDLGCLGLSIF